MRKKDDILWGVKGYEYVVWSSPEEFINDAIDPEVIVYPIGKDFDEDVILCEYKRSDVKKYAALKSGVLDYIIDELESDYGDPEGDDIFVATDRMKSAAADFVKIILEEYVPWHMVPTGREETVNIYKLCLKNRPDLTGENK